MTEGAAERRGNEERDENGAPLALDRRGRRRREVRDRMYVAAVDLFIEHGFDNTTMEQIADRADVARATVFNHFPRKAAFLDEWTARRRDRAFSALRADGFDAGTLTEALQSYMKEMARLSEETKAETVALLSATLHQTNFLAHPVLADELADLMGEFRDAGTAAFAVDTYKAGLIIATAYFATLSKWVAEPDVGMDLEAELLSVLDIILFGMLPADS